MDDVEALPNWAMKNQEKLNGKDELGWDWFDPLHCWEDLYIYWVKGKVKVNLMHHSRTYRVSHGVRGADSMPMAAELDAYKGRFFSALPCNSELRSKLKGGDEDRPKAN